MALLLLGGWFAAGADCAPQVGIAEAADCCACLAKTGPEGQDEVGAGGNCLPDDVSQGLSQQVERDQCAADAAESISGSGDVVVVVACLDDTQPCSTICGDAKAGGVVFAE